MGLKKDEILSIVSEQDIIEKYFGPITLKKLYVSPLRAPERTPSFHFFMHGGKLIYKDFGSGDSGDCFSFVKSYMAYKHHVDLSFPECLNIIANDFGLIEEEIDKKAIKKRFAYEAPFVDMFSKRKEFQYELKEFPEFGEQITFWTKYGISIEALKEYDAHNVQWFSFINKNGNTCVVKSKPFNPVYMYKYNEDGVRFYVPYGKKDKGFGIKHIGNAAQTDIFGFNQLNDYQDVIVFAAGQKDALSIYCNTGIKAISCISESTLPNPYDYEEISKKCKHIVVCYDNDKAGKKSSEMFKVAYPEAIILDISYITKLKDISDYYEEVIKNKQQDKFKALLWDTIFQSGKPL